MTVHIPTWVLWVLAVPAGLLVLICFLLGAALLFQLPKFRMWM